MINLPESIHLKCFFPVIFIPNYDHSGAVNIGAINENRSNWQWPMMTGIPCSSEKIRPLKYRDFSGGSDTSINSYRESKNIKNVELDPVSVYVPAPWHVALKTRRFATYKLQVVRMCLGLQQVSYMGAIY